MKLGDTYLESLLADDQASISCSCNVLVAALINLLIGNQRQHGKDNKRINSSLFVENFNHIHYINIDYGERPFQERLAALCHCHAVNTQLLVADGCCQIFVIAYY